MKIQFGTLKRKELENIFKKDIAILMNELTCDYEEDDENVVLVWDYEYYNQLE